MVYMQCPHELGSGLTILSAKVQVLSKLENWFHFGYDLSMKIRNENISIKNQKYIRQFCQNNNNIYKFIYKEYMLK